MREAPNEWTGRAGAGVSAMMAGLEIVFSEAAVETVEYCVVPKFSRHRSKRVRKKMAPRLHRTKSKPSVYELRLPGLRPKLIVHPALKAQLLKAAGGEQ